MAAGGERERERERYQIGSSPAEDKTVCLRYTNFDGKLLLPNALSTAGINYRQDFKIGQLRMPYFSSDENCDTFRRYGNGNTPIIFTPLTKQCLALCET